jgi:PAS domain S-box-containing protein
MIVGNEPVVTSELSLRLKNLGYRTVSIASSAEEAIGRAGTEHPDVILLDAALPGEPGGTATAKKLKEQYGFPVILIAKTGRDIPDRAKASTPFDTITKPVDEREVEIALEIAIHGQKAEMRIRALEDDLRKYRAHFEAVIARRTAELKKTNAQLHRLLHYIELTERKLATDSLDIEFQEDLERPFGTEEGVITVDQDLRVVVINGIALQMLGLTEDEAMGKDIGNVFLCQDETFARRLAESMQSMISAGSQGETFPDLAVKSRKGSILSLTAFIEPIFDNDNDIVGLVLTIWDAADTKKKENAAIRAQKLESLNMMVRGIAHDFNNILSSVMANVQLAKMDVNEKSHAYNRLNSAEDSVLRARELSQQMLNYTGGEIQQKKVTDLCELVRSVGTLAVRGSKSKCEYALPSHLWDVLLDEDLVKLVLNDLFLFLDGSMPSGGNIEISARNVISGSDKQESLGAADYIAIQLSAAQLVIPKEALDDLFRPGSSLAFALDLSVAESMIRKAGGVLDIKSDPAIGTSIHLYLPAVFSSPPVKEKMKETIRFEPKEDGKKKILLMDDEEAILSATGEMLNFLGYEVATARNGESAINMYQQARDSGSPFDGVILDITVPGGLGAQETIPRLVALDPSVKAIISSGYSTNPMIVDFKAFGFAAAIVKPYGFKELGEALDTVFR